MSCLGDLSALKLTGTGLAQPKIKPEVKYKNAGTKIVPTGSICLIGLRVKRPIIRAE